MKDAKARRWKKGRGKLGVLDPLLGTWHAQVETPMGSGKLPSYLLEVPWRFLHHP